MKNNRKQKNVFPLMDYILKSVLLTNDWFSLIISHMSKGEFWLQTYGCPSDNRIGIFGCPPTFWLSEAHGQPKFWTLHTTQKSLLYLPLSVLLWASLDVSCLENNEICIFQVVCINKLTNKMCYHYVCNYSHFVSTDCNTSWYVDHPHIFLFNLTLV